MKYEPGWFRRSFDAACAHPSRWVLAFACLCLLGGAAVVRWPPPYDGLFRLLPNKETDYSVREVFVALWATQAAMVAVVYPIVVAFVTILLQKQSASKASLEAYFVGSGAKLTGISSLSLVLVMAVQFPFIDQVQPLSAFAAMLADALWFIANSALSIYFLVVTFEFAGPDGRVRARNRYLLTRAWPGEWGFHVARQLWADPVGEKLLTAVQAFETMDDSTPAFCAQAGYFGTSTALAGEYRGHRAIVDVRFRLLQWAYNLWARRQHTDTSDAEKVPDGRAAFKRPGAVLELAAGVLEPIYYREPILRCSHGAVLSTGERLLVWLALRLSRTSSRPSVTVLDGLEEGRAEVLDAMSQDAEGEFRRRLEMLLEVYDQLIESSNVLEDGKPANWSLMGDTQDVFGWPLVRGWQRVFYDLHRRALAELSRSSFFAESTIGVPARFFARQRSFWAGELPQISLELQFYHLRSTLEWGAEQCAAAGAVGEHGALMNEPLRRRYEEVWKDGISAWESIKNWRIESRKDGDWQALTAAAPLFEAHLRHSVQLVSTALDGNDARGTFWTADSLFQWVQQTKTFAFEEGVAWHDRFKVTLGHLLLPLVRVREQFPLPEHQPESNATRQEVWQVAFRNLWTDYLCTLLANILVFRSANDQPALLGLDLVRTVLFSRDSGYFKWSGGEPLFSSADDLLYALIRQYAIAGGDLDTSYGTKLEKLADTIAPSPVSSGVPGRIYGSSGMAFDALLDGHLLMLVVLAGADPMAGRDFDVRISQWSAADSVRRRLQEFLRRAAARLRSDAFFAAMSASWAVLTEKGPEELRTRGEVVRAGLENYAGRVEAARATDIAHGAVSDAALQRIAQYAASGFQQRLDEAPLGLFSVVRLGESHQTEAPERRLSIQGWEKGALMDPPLAQIASNEKEYIARVAVSAVSREALRAILQMSQLQRRGMATREQFEAVVAQFGSETRDVRHEPLLLVPSRADPRWLLDMARRSAPGQVPALRSRRDAASLSSYVGHLGETAVYVAPLPSGQSLLLHKEMLECVEVLGPVGGPFRAVAEDASASDRCTLRLSWRQRVQLGDFRLLLLEQSSVDAAPGVHHGAT